VSFSRLDPDVPFENQSQRQSERFTLRTGLVRTGLRLACYLALTYCGEALESVQSELSTLSAVQLKPPVYPLPKVSKIREKLLYNDLE
jgi:hypothetical protein